MLHIRIKSMQQKVQVLENLLCSHTQIFASLQNIAQNLFSDRSILSQVYQKKVPF